MKSMHEYIDEYTQSEVHQERQLKINWLLDLACEGHEEFWAFLQSSDFYLAPASSKYHLNEFGGLVQHIIDVYEKLLEFKFTERDAARLALFHDLCKVGLYISSIGKSVPHYTEEEMEIRREIEMVYGNPSLEIEIKKLDRFKLSLDTTTWKSFLYGKQRGKNAKLRVTYDKIGLIFKINPDYDWLGHGEQSIIVALEHGVVLTDSEKSAIRWHMDRDDRDYTYSNDTLRGRVLEKHYEVVKALQRADQDASHYEAYPEKNRG
jgi:hypothetical protein